MDDLELQSRVAQALANTYYRHTKHANPIAWETLAEAAIAEINRETE